MLNRSDLNVKVVSTMPAACEGGESREIRAAVFFLTSSVLEFRIPLILI